MIFSFFSFNILLLNFFKVIFTKSYLWKEKGRKADYQDTMDYNCLIDYLYFLFIFCNGQGFICLFVCFNWRSCQTFGFICLCQICGVSHVGKKIYISSSDSLEVTIPRTSLFPFPLPPHSSKNVCPVFFPFSFLSGMQYFPTLYIVMLLDCCRMEFSPSSAMN